MTDVRSAALPAALFAALIALAGVTAHAQPGPRGLGGPQAAASAPGPGGGMMMRGRVGPGYTHGWSLMTPQEREEHRKRMSEARTPEECRAVRDEHRKQMEERARERGGRAMPRPRHDACGGWRRG